MCIFCEIVKGNIPSKKIYENDDVLAILDISQITKGHTLVMPKRHYENILDISDEDLTNVFTTVKLVTKMIDTKYNPLGFNVINNCKEAAGQSVMHFHVHIIPRYTADDLVMKHEDNTNKFDLDKILEEIR